jgi:hypothetical protein
MGMKRPFSVQSETFLARLSFFVLLGKIFADVWFFLQWENSCTSCIAGGTFWFRTDSASQLSFGRGGETGWAVCGTYCTVAGTWEGVVMGALVLLHETG